MSASARLDLPDRVHREHSSWLARTGDVIVHGLDGFEEVFELAQAGKEFELDSRARLKRVR